jgi:hypothetical protein
MPDLDDAQEGPNDRGLARPWIITPCVNACRFLENDRSSYPRSPCMKHLAQNQEPKQQMYIHPSQGGRFFGFSPFQLRFGQEEPDPDYLRCD